MDLVKAINSNNRWYKNCKSVRCRKGKICLYCPFKKDIIRKEKILARLEVLKRKRSIK